ncbi:hypothetical protein M422DRAFT_265643 [Sphaerobolus stellatus SS14]|uniref:ARID domain-containing protein n=1 Tax=Sphaerobolus stellatus (strain SS14) TaxID=990650 RepID=A0A0C9V4X9_SPHS4|nr:hypothetical protein M422DRAFT_265643 [Sphaerobolus stellatus SS14]
MPRQLFDQQFRAFMEQKGMMIDSRELTVNTKQIDLYNLWIFVLHHGGINTINQHSLWPVIGAQLGFVQFPASPSKPAWSNLDVGAVLQVMYSKYLAQWEHMYNLQMGQQERRKPAMTQNPGSPGGMVDLIPQQEQELLLQLLEQQQQLQEQHQQLQVQLEVQQLEVRQLQQFQEQQHSLQAEELQEQQQSQQQLESFCKSDVTPMSLFLVERHTSNSSKIEISNVEAPSLLQKLSIAAVTVSATAATVAGTATIVATVAAIAGATTIAAIAGAATIATTIATTVAAAVAATVAVAVEAVEAVAGVVATSD